LYSREFTRDNLNPVMNHADHHHLHDVQQDPRADYGVDTVLGVKRDNGQKKEVRTRWTVWGVG
jgi:hypothetical protein